MRPELIDKLKQSGVTMLPAATQQPQVQATGGVERLSPVAQQLLDAVRATQAATPVYMPFPGGTPTQRKTEAEEGKRQFDVTQDYRERTFDFDKDFKERQFAADEAYRAAQLALANIRGSGSGSGGSSAADVKALNTANAYSKIKEKVDEAWSIGGWAGAVDIIPQLEAHVRSMEDQFTLGGVNSNDVIDYIYKLIGGFTKKDGKWILESNANKDALKELQNRLEQ